MVTITLKSKSSGFSKEPINIVDKKGHVKVLTILCKIKIV